MAEASEPSIVEPSADVENGFNGGLDSDSDDYDPSTVITEDADSVFPAVPQIPTVTSALASSHPLPQRPTPQSEGIAPPTGSNQQPLSTQPRTKGGFELDEDDVEIAQDEDDADSKDMLDVYGADDGVEEDAVTNSAVPQGLIDSLSPSAKQANGVASIAVSQGALRGASGVDSSAALPAVADVDTQRVTTATPVPSITTIPVQAAPASENVTNLPGPVLAKGRLSHDVIGILEDRIKEDPRGDIDAWLALIEELKGRNKQEEVRKTYDRFLQIFPRCVCSP